jgi:hypothetical protein
MAALHAPDVPPAGLPGLTGLLPRSDEEPKKSGGLLSFFGFGKKEE